MRVFTMHHSRRLLASLFFLFPCLSSQAQTHLFTPAHDGLLPSLAAQISPKNSENLLLILHYIHQKDAFTIEKLHQCARTQPSTNPTDDNQDALVTSCQTELTNYTSLCLEKFSPLLCSQTAALIILHGATSLESLTIP